jgi:hypothetical protein
MPDDPRLEMTQQNYQTQKMKMAIVPHRASSKGLVEARVSLLPTEKLPSRSENEGKRRLSEVCKVARSMRPQWSRHTTILSRNVAESGEPPTVRSKVYGV